MVFVDFTAGETLAPHPGIELRTGPLDHPNGATGYRVEYGGKSLAYITDTEHREGKLDANVLRLIDRVDVMVYDTSYTDEEFPSKRDWGHSTWQEAVRLADAAKVRKLVLFHHDPAHDDEFMDRVKAEAEVARPGTIVAYEGLILKP
jgi:phosphoribosyl 1,2-cyclic phosphodiesterase